MPVFVLPIGNAACTHPLNLSVLEKSVHVESALQIQADLVILLINMHPQSFRLFPGAQSSDV